MRLVDFLRKRCFRFYLPHLSVIERLCHVGFGSQFLSLGGGNLGLADDVLLPLLIDRKTDYHDSGQFEGQKPARHYAFNRRSRAVEKVPDVATDSENCPVRIRRGGAGVAENARHAPALHGRRSAGRLRTGGLSIY